MLALKKTVFIGASILLAVELEHLGRLLSKTPGRINVDNASQPQFGDNDLVLFYNVFVPGNENIESDAINPKFHALAIVQEHLNQMESLFAQLQRSGRTQQSLLPIYYVTIGDPTTASAVQKFCRSPLACLHQGHYAFGFEELTLQVAYEYCLHHPRSKIIYLHNKGSFHPDVARVDISQNAWRQRATEGAMHPDCLDPPEPQCNLCGIFIEVVPTIRQPGNFWSASCDYVQKLIPPIKFGIAQEALYVELQKQMMGSPQLHQQPLLDAQFWVLRNASLGLGRFANEVWIGSHPEVTPCDVSPATSFSSYKHVDAAVPIPQFGMLPKRTFQEILDSEDIGSLDRKQSVMQNETLRKRDYFLLPGLLFKSAFHYQSLPLNTSWVFDQYPDGPYWRQAVMRQHNVET